MKHFQLGLAALIVGALGCNAPGLGSEAAKPAGAGGGLGDPTVEPTTVTATPAGELIVYTCFVDGSDEVCLMNADGSNQRQLTNDPATDFYASLSSDGLTIIFSTRRDGQFEIYTMGTNGENLKRLTEKMGDNYAPIYSPDGSQIAYISTASGNQDIWIMGADGSNPRRVTDRVSEEYDPVWSPDGTRIAFASSYTGTNELYVIDADGANLVQVTADSGMREGGRSDWSPDGQHLAIYAGVQGDKNIFLVPVSCVDSEPCGPAKYTQVTAGGNAKAPSFSPDGLKIVFAGGPTKNNDLFIINVDGTGLLQLTSGAFSEWQPRWGR